MADMNQIESLYIHFPFCLKRCNYCDFYSQLEGGAGLAPYQQRLDQQFLWLNDFHQQHAAAFAPLKTLYVGGGTPSLWRQAGREWFAKLFESMTLDREYEWTIEVNPGTADIAELEQWMKMGVNRFSVGSQSLDPFYLKALDRLHSAEQTLELLRELNKLQCNYSVDLMLGLPFSQTKQRNLERELAPLLEMKIPHLSAYILTVEQEYCHAAHLPDDDYAAEEYLRLAKLLTLSGYRHYEVSNFALPQHESQHNLRYWKNLSVAALGDSAVGTIVEQDQTWRYRFDPQSGSAKTELVDGAARKLEEVFLGLRSCVGVSKDLFLPRHSELIQEWQHAGLVLNDAQRLRLTSKGYLQADTLINQMFSHKII